MAFEVELGPIALVTNAPGFVAPPINAVCSRATRSSEIKVPGIAARHSPRHVIDDVQDAESPAAGKLVADEIHRPASVRLGSRPGSASATPRRALNWSLAHRGDLLRDGCCRCGDARGFALLPQQDEQPTISGNAPPRVGEIAQLRPKLRGPRPTGAAPDHLAVSADDRAGPPFR